MQRDLPHHERRLSLQLDSFDLCDAVTEVADSFREAATKAGCDLEVAARGPIVGAWDRLRIEQILSNLVGNAIKYAPPAGVVAFRLVQRGDSACLDVVDNGPGIDPDERERIFDSFYQGKAPPGGRVKGSGLGLAIAREYTLAHGGRLEVLDREDGERGACFRLTLPLAMAGAHAEPKTSPAKLAEGAK